MVILMLIRIPGTLWKRYAPKKEAIPEREDPFHEIALRIREEEGLTWHYSESRHGSSSYQRVYFFADQARHRSAPILELRFFDDHVYRVRLEQVSMPPCLKLVVDKN